MSKSVLFQLLLILLSSYGGTIASTVVVLGVLIWNLSKNNLADALSIFLVLLLFSDSTSSFYSNPGKAKDFAALVLAFYIFTKTKSPLKHAYIQTFFPYLGVALLGLLLINFNIIGDQKEFKVIGFQKLLSYGLLMIIIPASLMHILRRPGGIQFIRKLIFLFVVFYAFSVFMSRINPMVYATFGRFNGIHRNPNGVGIFSSLFIMNLFLIRDKFPRIFSTKVFWAFVTLFLGTIVLCASRNALLSLGIFFLFRTIKVKFFLGLILVIVIASSYGLITYFVEQLLTTAGLEDEMRLDTISYASGRIYIWEACLLEIQNNYWLGHGFTYEEWSKWDQKYYEVIPMLIHNYGNIHNSYLTIWLNTGLLGLASFILGLIVLVVRAQKRSPSIAPMFFAAIIIGFFESYLVASLNPYTWQIWFGFTIALFSPSLLPVPKNKRKKPSLSQQKQSV